MNGDGEADPGGLAASELARAAALLEVGRPEEALRQLARLPASLANEPLAFELRAAAYLSMSRWAEAADAARRGLAAGPPDPDLLGMLGTALEELGDHPGAERAMLDGLALEPTNVDLLCRYARLCMTVGQADKARRLLDAAMDEDPDAAIVYATRIDLAYARGQDREAERISSEFLGVYPNHPLALALHGRSASMRGRVAPAYGSFRQAVAGAPGDSAISEGAWTTRLNAHPLLWPLRPLYRFGMIKTWLFALVMIFGLRALGFDVASFIWSISWGLYCVYSWVAPGIVRRLIGRGPGDKPQARPIRVLKAVAGVMILLIGLFCAGMAGRDIGPLVRAANGDGRIGTFTITSVDCAGDRCSYYGDFVSDDGAVTLREVSMDNGLPGDVKVGTQIRARDAGDSDEVYPPNGSNEWIFATIFLVVGVLLVVGWILAVPVVALLRRR
jgi:tetratricopeptide (TPR) repeat protein